MQKGLISIDRWSEKSQAYFLTHLHADHTEGLSPHWSGGPIFCSPISARLFPCKFPGFDLSLLRVLEVGRTHPLSLSSPTNGSEVQILVTPIDAHHCPGAVMYLFRGEFGCVLYTGDFRWELKSERAKLAKKTLLDALQGDKVNNLYLDNTYCHPSFSFPPREVAAQQVVDIITQHPNHEIVVGIDTLGKEGLLLHISQALSTKIWVWPERLQTMHLLGFDNIFTTKTSLTRVRAVPRYSLTFETLEALNTIHPTIGIMPSGLPWGLKSPKVDDTFGTSLENCCECKGSATSRIQLETNQIQPPRKLHRYAYSVPYSEHSCFTEIEEFVKIIKPSVVTGIVSSSFYYINPRHYFGYLCGFGHLFHKPCRNFRCEKAKNAEVNQCQSFPRCRSSNKLKERKEGSIKFASFSVRSSRLSAIRKGKCGVKIMEID
ncbi:uncharacterized protein [Elaeis guineensis]|uniref:Protein artemis n=1 Tax=Elaeis guineensis var. tenera TaxID=51953 RepID=A0A6I9S4J5_ELAGV|nr:5' exonuclease Apollo [Elaeis guineensis]